MAATVIVNGLTIVHRDSGGLALNGPPDVCNTPLPSGPTPIPYPNIALSKDLVDGAASVVADGGCPVANTASAFSPSTGDEPGTLGGVISGVNKGKAKFYTFSPNVLIEGKPACRLSDAMSMNGNDPNTITPAEVQPNVDKISQEGSVFCDAFCFCNVKENGKWRRGEKFVNKKTRALTPHEQMERWPRLG